MSVSRFVAALVGGWPPSLSTPRAAAASPDLIPELFHSGIAASRLPQLQRQCGHGHGSHYIGSTVQGTDNLIDSLRRDRGSGVERLGQHGYQCRDFPVRGRRPVQETRSAGPIFGERVQTLARGDCCSVLT
jgi:hypothetical protein